MCRVCLQRALFALGVIACATACGNASDSPATSGPSTSAVATPDGAASATARSAAESIRASVPEVTDVIDLTEDNDTNNLIGRPNGYVAATVLVDSRLAGNVNLKWPQCDGAKWPHPPGPHHGPAHPPISSAASSTSPWTPRSPSTKATTAPTHWPTQRGTSPHCVAGTKMGPLAGLANSPI